MELKKWRITANGSSELESEKHTQDTIAKAGSLAPSRIHSPELEKEKLVQETTQRTKRITV